MGVEVFRYPPPHPAASDANSNIVFVLNFLVDGLDNRSVRKLCMCHLKLRIDRTRKETCPAAAVTATLASRPQQCRYTVIFRSHYTYDLKSCAGVLTVRNLSEKTCYTQES